MTFAKLNKKEETLSNNSKRGEVLIPLGVFLDRDVSVLEAVSEYLKDTQGMNYHEIGELLNRDERTIWTCCYRAKKKRKKKPVLKEGKEKISSKVFLDREVSVLEAITEHLKEKRGMTYHEMGVLLNRDDRTVWTCYNRAKKKRGSLAKGVVAA